MRNNASRETWKSLWIARWIGLVWELAGFGYYTYGAFDAALRHLRGGPDVVGVFFLVTPPVELAFVAGGALGILVARRPGLALRWSVHVLGYLVSIDLLVVLLYVYAYGIV
ncbi:MAG TPA: hypothetical protein VFB58_13570 [Chloroflexota bacterium]|nr:hypothetical protein [Chloroflexota bacterium]